MDRAYIFIGGNVHAAGGMHITNLGRIRMIRVDIMELKYLNYGYLVIGSR